MIDQHNIAGFFAFSEDIEIKLPELWFSEYILSDIMFIINIWLISTAVSMIFNYILRKYPKYTKLFLLCNFPGVVIHELSHLIACLMTRVKILEVRLFIWDSGEGAIGAKIDDRSPITTFFIAFAPVISGSIIVYCAINLIEELEFSLELILLLGWLIISIVLSCGPSFPDIRIFFYSIIRDLKTTMRDFCFIAFSLLIYASIGQNLFFILGNIPFIHFVFIILLQFGLFLIYRIIKRISAEIIDDLDTKRRYSAVKVLIPPQIKEKKVKSRSLFYNENRIQQIGINKCESKTAFFRDIVDQNL